MDIREKIAREDFNRFNEVFMDNHVPNQCYRFADRILAIKLEEDEACDCKNGEVSVQNRFGAHLYYEPCGDCDGKGKVLGRTLKKLLDEEVTNEQRSQQ